MEEQTYHVMWEIDIDAVSPQEASRQALKIQRDRKSTATVFIVTDSKGNKIVTDLG
jgi:spore germination protein YaaH